MPISNPILAFIDGNNTKEFVYEGGKILYYFSAQENGLSSSHDCNVIFLADNEEHAKNVLERMFEHIITCNRSYLKSKEARKSNTYNFINNAKERMSIYQDWKKALEADKIKIVKAPTNQFYKVGWAFNDTI